MLIVGGMLQGTSPLAIRDATVTAASRRLAAMATAPYGVRLLVGAAVTAVEETRKLPQTILMYPMTVVSQAAHIVMKMQQDVADLVIKGDDTLETLFPPKDEQPEWATFDEDLTTKPRRYRGRGRRTPHRGPVRVVFGRAAGAAATAAKPARTATAATATPDDRRSSWTTTT